MTTVHELRQGGNKVCVKHVRYINPSDIDPSPHDPKGGMTVVTIDTPEGVHYEGVALCSPKDNYNKRMGVKIALNRAFFDGPTEQRKPIPSTLGFINEYHPAWHHRRIVTYIKKEPS